MAIRGPARSGLPGSRQNAETGWGEESAVLRPCCLRGRTRCFDARRLKHGRPAHDKCRRYGHACFRSSMPGNIFSLHAVLSTGRLTGYLQPGTVQ